MAGWDALAALRAGWSLATETSRAGCAFPRWAVGGMGPRQGCFGCWVKVSAQVWVRALGLAASFPRALVFRAAFPCVCRLCAPWRLLHPEQHL